MPLICTRAPEFLSEANLPLTFHAALGQIFVKQAVWVTREWGQLRFSSLHSLQACMLPPTNRQQHTVSAGSFDGLKTLSS